MYSSANQPLIYQKKPLWSKPSLHQNKGWTDSIQGYLNEAKQLTVCLFRNSVAIGRSYSWFVTIYVDVEMCPTDVNSFWTKAKRKLAARGVVALWVREPTKSNKVHYHLLLSSEHTAEQLTEIIEDCFPNRKTTRWHKSIRPVKNQFRLLYYISKAKLSGYTSAGCYCVDLYAKKRLLFQPGLGIHKLGTIGNFWLKSRDEIWSDVRNEQRMIEEGLNQPLVRTVCNYFNEILGPDVTLKRIQRSYASQWDTDKFRSIAASVLDPTAGFYQAS